VVVDSTFTDWCTPTAESSSSSSSSSSCEAGHCPLGADCTCPDWKSTTSITTPSYRSGEIVGPQVPHRRSSWR
jgi:hypothetical protein